jgi:hypothetical protein
MIKRYCSDAEIRQKNARKDKKYDNCASTVDVMSNVQQVRILSIILIGYEKINLPTSGEIL